jgi:4a-hydroxytetrahydrobiopterin dehydratase
MNELIKKSCTACQPGAPQATEGEIETYMPLIPEWRIVDVGGVKRLKRVFEFTDFKEALAFTVGVGAIAEEEGHHPRVTTEWGRVTVQWWTHKIGGLHVNDFIMAAKTDALT